MRTDSAFFPRMMPWRPRDFGSDLAPPRLAHFAVIPTSLAFFGLLSWMLGNDLGFVMGSVVASVVGLYTFWEWLLRSGPTRFSTLLAMALLLGYGGGALNTWVTLPRGSLTIAAVMGLGTGTLARAIGAVLLSSALLYFWGEIFEKPIFGRDFQFSVGPRTRALIYAGTLAMIAGFATHAMGFQGAAVKGGHLNPFGAFLGWLYSPLTAIAVTGFLTARRGMGKVLCGIAAVVLLLMLSAMGRRNAIYTGVEILLVAELAGYQWQGRAAHKIMMILGLAGIIAAASLTFMVLRLAGYSLHSDEATVGQRLEVADKMVQKGNAYTLASSMTKVNLQSRTFVLGYFSNILDASSRQTPALGEDVTEELKLGIPGFLYPNKDRTFSEELLVDKHFGFGFGDEANSIVTAGATDFGLAGVLIYPLLLVLLMRIFFEIGARCFRTVPLMFFALSLIFVCMQTELPLSGYIEILRVVFFFALLIAAFMAMPSFRLRSGRY